MTGWAKAVVVLALVAYAAFGLPKMPATATFASSSSQEPSAEMKARVSKVAAVVRRMNVIDRLWLQYIYRNAARVVKADEAEDPQVITTTEGLRAIHVAILKYIWKGMADNPAGKYPELSDAIEQVFVETLGENQRTLTPALRDKACEMFDAIAWAGLGKDE